MAQLVLSLNECIDTANNLIEDHKYSLSKAKAPAKRRQYERSLAFWSAIHFHLTEHKKVQGQLKKQ